jgi:hypothetical protein
VSLPTDNHCDCDYFPHANSLKQQLLVELKKLLLFVDLLNLSFSLSKILLIVKTIMIKVLKVSYLAEKYFYNVAIMALNED